MSPIRVGINGFGRMGRLALRALFEYWRNDITIVHINDPKASAATAAHLLTFDSVHGRWPVPVTVNGGTIVIGSNDAQWTISTSGETNPKLVKWHDVGVDIVIESSGKFVTPESLSVYFGHEQSPRKVIVSAPVKGALNIVMGVNDGEYDEKKCPDIVTAASCTTNCLAPVIDVLLKRVGIIHGSITTIHNVTNTQTVVDAPHADLRRARSCLTSLVPTTTGSATAISLIFPELKGKLNGLAVRVPLLNASITDCAIEVKKPVTVEEVNQWMEEASAAGPLKDILGVERLPLVSADFNNDRRSAIVDATNTLVVNGTHVKLIVWYDNEVGYANRLSELTVLVAKRLSLSSTLSNAISTTAM